ncbi:hypothetical protein BDN71DRAFT_1454118 [Pleurotus eryngii]|uniref:Uncharacterized protein n=1 Tax=Pleurotus eryngii TaxID=5323 RepID=A0A9P5ZQI3_PLEER|nr:hypothetical protein BDN71DRAFT_1454118 [Pleurotus eryngii]
MQSFFDCLTEVEGVIFGDVALRVQVRAHWQLWGMHIAIPHGHAVALVGWLTNCGYIRRPVSRPHSWGTTHIYGLQNLQVQNRWVYLYESENELAVTPVLSSKSTARMTMLTAHALASLYTGLTDENVCVTTTALDVLHYQAFGFRVYLEAKGMDSACQSYCPRNRRALDSGHSIDILNWGGLMKDEAIPDVELDIFKGQLFWVLGDTCHNVLCGRCGADQDSLLF